MANYTTASEELGDAFPTRNIASTPEWDENGEES